MSHPLALPKFSQPAAPPLTGACLLGRDPLPPLSNLGTCMELGYGLTVWDLVGDRICSAARDAARLFLILLCFVVHGHHGNGISVEGMHDHPYRQTSWESTQGRQLQRSRSRSRSGFQRELYHLS